jgi:hypothetical protein
VRQRGDLQELAELDAHLFHAGHRLAKYLLVDQGIHLRRTFTTKNSLLPLQTSVDDLVRVRRACGCRQCPDVVGRLKQARDRERLPDLDDSRAALGCRHLTEPFAVVFAAGVDPEAHKMPLCVPKLV